MDLLAKSGKFDPTFVGFTDQERYEHVGPQDTRPQDDDRSQVDDQRLDLADDLKKAQDHIFKKNTSIEQETHDLDMENKHMKNLKASYGVTIMQELRYMGDDVDINTLTMEKYLALIQDNIRPNIVKPEFGDDVKFEINGNIMRELRRKLFKGTDNEDAHERVRRVLEIVDLFHFPGVTHDAVMLRVFPVILTRPALRWKNKLSAGSITTWDLLKKAFIG
nr:hypothetical protein [Tanacetum cinerariifolium]